MKIFYEGAPKDEETEAKVKAIVDGIGDEGHDYVIGIDYASKHSKDYTAVAKFKKNKDGILTLENIEYI